MQIISNENAIRQEIINRNIKKRNEEIAAKRDADEQKFWAVIKAQKQALRKAEDKVSERESKPYYNPVLPADFQLA